MAEGSVGMAVGGVGMTEEGAGATGKRAGAVELGWEWRARQDLNLRPLPPQGSALIR